MVGNGKGQYTNSEEVTPPTITSSGQQNRYFKLTTVQTAFNMQTLCSWESLGKAGKFQIAWNIYSPIYMVTRCVSVHCALPEVMGAVSQLTPHVTLWWWYYNSILNPCTRHTIIMTLDVTVVML